MDFHRYFKLYSIVADEACSLEIKVMDRFRDNTKINFVELFKNYFDVYFKSEPTDEEIKEIEEFTGLKMMDRKVNRESIFPPGDIDVIITFVEEE